MSLVVFIAIGGVRWIDMKGGNALFGVSILGSLWSSLSGRDPLGWIPSLALWLAGWIVVATVLGWCLQGILVMTVLRHEKSKPSA